MPRQRSNISMAEQLRFWRARRGFSQSKLAKLAETSALTISQLESGKRKARGKTLEKILQGLKLSREEFFAMHEKAAGAIPAEAIDASTGLTVGYAESGAATSREAAALKLSNLDLELLNRILNLDFEGKIETLRFLQNLK